MRGSDGEDNESVEIVIETMSEDGQRAVDTNRVSLKDADESERAQRSWQQLDDDNGNRGGNRGY
jgi:hypothetical protein